MTVMFVILAGLIGMAVGWAHFASLVFVTDLLVAGRMTGLLLQLGRFAVLGVFLWLCALAGWVVLIVGAAGVMAGRFIVLKRAR